MGSVDMTEFASPAEMELRQAGNEYAEFLNDPVVAEKKAALLAEGKVTQDELDLLEAMSGEQLIAMGPEKAKDVAAVIAKLKNPLEAK